MTFPRCRCSRGGHAVAAEALTAGIGAPTPTTSSANKSRLPDLDLGGQPPAYLLELAPTSWSTEVLVSATFLFSCSSSVAGSTVLRACGEVLVFGCFYNHTSPQLRRILLQLRLEAHAPHLPSAATDPIHQEAWIDCKKHRELSTSVLHMLLLVLSATSTHDALGMVRFLACERCQAWLDTWLGLLDGDAFLWQSSQAGGSQKVYRVLNTNSLLALLLYSELNRQWRRCTEGR